MCGADEGRPIVIMKSDLEIANSTLRMIIYFPDCVAASVTAAL